MFEKLVCFLMKTGKYWTFCEMVRHQLLKPMETCSSTNMQIGSAQ